MSAAPSAPYAGKPVKSILTTLVDPVLRITGVGLESDAAEAATLAARKNPARHFMLIAPKFMVPGAQAPPNDGTERRGRPSASQLTTEVARPRSLQ